MQDLRRAGVNKHEVEHLTTALCSDHEVSLVKITFYIVYVLTDKTTGAASEGVKDGWACGYERCS